MDNLFDISGKNVIITGGAGILCGEMAQALAERGARVCVADYDSLRAHTVCQEIEAKGGFALPIEINVLERRTVQEAFSCAVQSLGHIDILINGAGGNRKEATCAPPTTFFDLPENAIKMVFDLNCMGTMLPCQIVGKHMAERGQGTIVNISSMNALRPLTNIAAYSAAKAAISNFTQWLATYMATRHSPSIRVNAIAPGFFLTEQNRFLLTDEKTGDLTARGRTILSHTPMARFGQPDELIGTLIWLLSDAAKFVTGITIPVDGGFSAYSGV
jgi:NAD(P)-dependent dehydrogenase (short-subunit alcohol dehydrogenase family)